MGVADASSRLEGGDYLPAFPLPYIYARTYRGKENPCMEIRNKSTGSFDSMFLNPHSGMDGCESPTSESEDNPRPVIPE